MNRQNRIHRVLFRTEHHLQFVGTYGDLECFQFGLDLIQNPIVLLLRRNGGKHLQIFEIALLSLPFVDRVRQSALFPEDGACLLRFVPKTFFFGYFLQFPNAQFFFRNVKGRLRNVLFAGPDPLWFHEFLRAWFLLLFCIHS